MKDLDINELSTEMMSIMSSMVVDMISGKPVPKDKITVEIEVPSAIVQAIKKVAEKSGLEPEIFYAKLATEGFNQSIQSLIKQEVSTTVSDSMKEKTVPETGDVAQALGGIGEKMEQFQGLISQFQDLQKVFENVGVQLETNDNSETNKDSK